MAEQQYGPEEVQRWLKQFLTPNTRLIQEATIWLKNFLKKPYSIPVMCDILLNGSNPTVRSFLIQTLGQTGPRWSQYSDELGLALISALCTLMEQA